MGNICKKVKTVVPSCITPDLLGQKSVIFPDLCLFSNQNSIIRISDGMISLHPYDSIDYTQNSAIGKLDTDTLMVTGGNRPFSKQVFSIDLNQRTIGKFTDLPVKVKGGVFLSFQKSVFYGGGSYQENNEQKSTPIYYFDEAKAKWIELEWELSSESSGTEKSSVVQFGHLRKYGLCLYPEQSKIFIIGGERWSHSRKKYKANRNIMAYNIQKETFERTAFKCPLKLIHPICLQGKSKHVFITGGYKQKVPKQPNLQTCFINLRNGDFKNGITLPFPINNYFPSLYTRRYILVSSYPRMFLLLAKHQEWMTFSINLEKEKPNQGDRIQKANFGLQIDKTHTIEENSQQQQRHKPLKLEFQTKKHPGSTPSSLSDTSQPNSSTSFSKSQNKKKSSSRKGKSKSSDESSDFSSSSTTKKPKEQEKKLPNKQKIDKTSSSSSSSDHGKMRSVSGMIPLQKYRPVTSPSGVMNLQMPSMIREAQQESSSESDDFQSQKKPQGRPPIKPGTFPKQPNSPLNKEIKPEGFALHKPTISGKIGGKPQAFKQSSKKESSSSSDSSSQSGGFKVKKPSVSGKLGGKPGSIPKNSSGSSINKGSGDFNLKKPAISGKIGLRPVNTGLQNQKKPMQRIMMAQSGIIGKPPSPRRSLKRKSDSSSSQKYKPVKKEEEKKTSRSVQPVNKMVSSPINYRAIPIKSPIQAKKSSSSSSDQPKKQFAPPKSISSNKILSSKPSNTEEAKQGIPAWKQVAGQPFNQAYLSPKDKFAIPAIPEIQGSSRLDSSWSDEPGVNIRGQVVDVKRLSEQGQSPIQGVQMRKITPVRKSSSSSSDRSSEFSSSQRSSNEEASSSNTSNSQSDSEESNSSTKYLTRRSDDHQCVLDRYRAESFVQLVFKYFGIENKDVLGLFQEFHLENMDKVTIDDVHKMLDKVMTEEQYKVQDVIKVIENTHQVFGKSKVDRGKVWKPLMKIGISPQVKDVTKVNAVLALSRGLKLMIR